MKFIHISDLHLGKRVNEFSMLEEQKYILQQVLDTVQNEAVDAVLIAGDIYDKPVPPAEAVVLFDTFLTRLSQMKKEVFIISGTTAPSGSHSEAVCLRRRGFILRRYLRETWRKYHFGTMREKCVSICFHLSSRLRCDGFMKKI